MYINLSLNLSGIGGNAESSIESVDSVGEHPNPIDNPNMQPVPGLTNEDEDDD